ncbi:MAG: metallophosphoesterase [Pirellulaceae bacterium]
MLPAFYRFVSDQIIDWQPEIVCLTGDIVDKTHCIEWIDDCFSRLAAPAGCYFILGNHDDRVADPEQVRQRMQSLGWTDVGGKVCVTSYRETKLLIAGNERPWFGSLPALDNEELDTADEATTFRLLLSHSPDQIEWARKQRVQLMLAGHTHGGHGRLPLVGPLLSPSHYGSRFASGEFYLSPTTMHVTRGLFGTHMQRIRCRPELSLLNLRQAVSDDASPILPSA